MRRLLVPLLVLLSALARPQIEAEQPFPLLPPKRWAIVIGAGKYDTLGELRYAPADARDFAKLLIDDYKFKPESVTKLIDDAGETPPTVANIRAKLDETLKDPRLNKGDLFIFYFSGHGVGMPQGDFLCPTDARKDNIAEVGLPIKEVMERIVKAGLRNVLVIADACRGGEKNSFGAELTKLSDQANIGVMLGCEPGRRSYQNARGGHGYFTESLLEALKKPDLRQKETGALWASELGKWVSEDVREATSKRENIPQVPAIECDDRRDVMVGAFIPPDFDEKTIEVLKAVREGLDQQRMAAALADYADRLWDRNLLYECAEVLRIAESYGGLDEAGRIMLASALWHTDRLFEASSQFKKVAESKIPFHAAFGVLMDPANEDRLAKIKAAGEIFSTVPNATMACKMVGLSGDPGDSAERTALLHRFLAEATDLKDQTRLYLEAEIALDRGDFAEAEAKFRKAIATFGLQLEPNRIRWRLALVLISQQKAEETIDVCTEAIETHSSDESGWLCLRALVYRFHLSNSDAACADAQKALTFDLSAKNVIACLKASGIKSFELTDSLTRFAKQQPRTVEGQIAGFIADNIKGTLPFTLPKDHVAFRYADDPRTVVMVYEAATASFWEDLIASGSMEPGAMAAMFDSRASALLTHASSAGEDSDFWGKLAERCLQARRAPQALIYFDRVWSRALKESRIPAEMVGSYAMLALAAGDWSTLDRVHNARALGGNAKDIRWFDALSLIIRGQENQGLALIANLAAPSPGYADVATSLKLYAKAAAVSPMEAKKLLESAPLPELVVGNVIIALAWLRIGEVDKAGPLLEQAGAIDNWAFQAIDAYALSRLATGLKKRGDIDGSNEIVFLLQFMFPWTPGLTEIHYGLKAGVAEYTGDYSFSGTQIADDRTITPCKIGYNISSAGDVKGKIGEYVISGKVDSLGNLKGTALVNGKPWSLYAKLAPKALYATHEQLKNGNQTLILQSPDGPRLAFLLKPVSGSG